MKTEDIDKMIGMPDIDKEWARFEKEVINESKSRRWAVAASIAVIFCLGVAAAVYYRSMEPSGTVTREVEERVEAAMELQDTETFVFDNVEMQAVADTLGRHYKVQTVFQSEEAKHVRLYFQVEKSKSIEEVVELLNHFSKVSVTLQDKQFIIK